MLLHAFIRAASMTLRTILISIQCLLSSPEPNDPQDAVVANQYLKKIDIFKKTAKYWAQHYAAGIIGKYL